MTPPADLLPLDWRGERVSRIILGTVQLGMGYGIANTTGQPAPDKARDIIQAAWAAGIRHFDTAQAYGTSEAALGRAFAELGLSNEACVTSKLALPANPADVQTSIENTLALLRVDRLWCMMFHHPRHLDEWNTQTGEILRAFRRDGTIRHIGASISPLVDAQRCLDCPGIDIIQLPCNAWDRRPLQLGLIEAARTNGQLCCVRSIYLQGLLTMPPEAVAARIPAAEPAARAWHAFAAASGLSPKELAVRFAVGLDTPLVIGAETPDQIAETAALAARGPLPLQIIQELAAAMDPTVSDDILEPWRWPEKT